MLRATDRSGRLVGVDLARCAALVGMAATHILPSFGGDGDLHPSHAIASGRAAALFAVLAGVGIALASGGRTRLRGRDLNAARAGVVARAALLVFLGTLLEVVESPPLVILAYYGLLFLVAVPVLCLSAGPLAALAVVAALATPVVSHLLRRGSSPPVVEEPGGSDVVVDLLLTGTYPVLTWTAYLFAGLAIGRLHLGRLGVAVRLLVVGSAVAIAAKVVSAVLLGAVGGAERLEASDVGLYEPVDDALASGLFGVTPTGDWRWLTISAPHSGTTLDLLHTIGTSMAVLGVGLLLARLLPRTLLLPFAAAGSMTLTLYTLHVLVLTDGSPFLMSDRLSLWLLHVAVALVLATVWRTTIGRGPLEAVAAAADGGARQLVSGQSSRVRSRV